jgi:hypothetical protein
MTILETPLLSTRQSTLGLVRPTLSDKAFWSESLLSPQVGNPPINNGTFLITDSSIFFVDSDGNNLVAY